MSLDELKEALNKKTAILGSKRTIKLLKNQKIKLIIIANNCPEIVERDLNQYSKLSNVKIERFEGTAKQLGIFCGKPFPVATVSIKK